MKSFLVLFIIFHSFCSFAKLLKIEVQLSPAGNFSAETQSIIGVLNKDGQSITSAKLGVKVSNLKTGIDLRDEHFFNYLEEKKYPLITLSEIKIIDGKGSGKLQIKNKIKTVDFLVVKKDDKYISEFKVALKDFGLEAPSYMLVSIKEEVNIYVEFNKNEI
jgi:hypothetical protein